MKAEKQAAKTKIKVLTKFLIKFILVTCLASVQGGFNYWLANDPATLKQYFHNISVELSRKESRGNAIPLSLLICMVVAFPLGCLLGTLIFGSLADICGRKRLLLFADIFSILTAFSMAVSNYFQAYAIYALACFCAGLYTSIFASGVPLLLGEISPSNWRGGISIIPMFALSIGIIVSQLLSAPEILGSKTGIPVLQSIPGIMALFQFVLLYPFPESPRYLLIQKRDEEGARNALQKLRGEDNVADEIDELNQEDAYEGDEKPMNIFKLLFYPGLRWPLFCVVALYTTQQFSGVNAAYYYSEKIFIDLDIGCMKFRYCSIFVTTLTLCGQALAIYKIDSWGRRPLLLVGFSICILTSVLLTMTLELQAVMPEMANASILLLIAFLTGIVIGPNSIPPLMVTELFLQSSRASAFSVSAFYQAVLIIIVSSVFMGIEKHIKTYSFLIFFPFCVIGFVYIFRIVPETKGKTFLGIRKLLEVFLARKAKKAEAKNKQQKEAKGGQPTA